MSTRYPDRARTFNGKLKPNQRLVVSPLELVAIFGAVIIANSVVRDAETNWLEGLLLLSVYLILGFAVFFYPVA